MLLRRTTVPTRQPGLRQRVDSSPDETSQPARVRRGLHGIVALYALTALFVTLQRGVLGPQHNVFKIFRQSFWHLLAGRNLYAAYPLEQGGAAADLFKYSPTAALLFAPFALPPYGIALFAWSLVGALLLFHGLTRVLEPERALIASLLVYPDLIASLQACSSNAQVAALILLAFAAIEHGQAIRGSLAMVIGATVKLFPLAAITFALFHSRRRRFAAMVAVVAIVLLLAPLLVTGPAVLVQQYRWWIAIERSDAADVMFGLSLMRLLRGWVGGTWPNWPVQLAGTLVLLLPVAIYRARWRDADFRLAYLASLLVFAVLFNHQAERASFVIASAGVAIWCVSPPAGRSSHPMRVIVAIFALIGLKTIPLALVWLVMQAELHGWAALLRPTAGVPLGTHPFRRRAVLVPTALARALLPVSDDTE
jgi:hypothetical protein